MFLATNSSNIISTSRVYTKLVILVWKKHGNFYLILFVGDVEETVTHVEIDEETFEEFERQNTRSIPMLFVRGDGVILVAPPLRSTA